MKERIISGENEKWSRLKAIKQELVTRAIEEGCTYTLDVDKAVLIEFISNRIENNNNNLIKSMTYSNDTVSTSVAEQEFLQKCTAENVLLTALLTEANELSSQNVTGIGELWNELWDDIIEEQAPPSNFS